MTVHVQRNLTAVNTEYIGKFKFTVDRYRIMMEINSIPPQVVI